MKHYEIRQGTADDKRSEDFLRKMYHLQEYAEKEFKEDFKEFLDYLNYVTNRFMRKYCFETDNVIALGRTADGTYFIREFPVPADGKTYMPRRDEIGCYIETDEEQRS